MDLASGGWVRLKVRLHITGNYIFFVQSSTKIIEKNFHKIIWINLASEGWVRLKVRLDITDNYVFIFFRNT